MPHGWSTSSIYCQYLYNVVTLILLALLMKAFLELSSPRMASGLGDYLKLCDGMKHAQKKRRGLLYLRILKFPIVISFTQYIYLVCNRFSPSDIRRQQFNECLRYESRMIYSHLYRRVPFILKSWLSLASPITFS